MACGAIMAHFLGPANVLIFRIKVKKIAKIFSWPRVCISAIITLCLLPAAALSDSMGILEVPDTSNR